MKLVIAVTTLLIAAIAGPVSARDPLAPLDRPETCWSCDRAMVHGPDAFGSVAVRAGVTIYDARFRRVARTDAEAPSVVAAARTLRGLEANDQLSRAHAMMLRRLKYMSDPDSMKVADLWANAGETLASGHGDDEDIAIAEMQVLKAAGFPAGDLFLSVGKHRSSGAHTVLLARTPRGFYMLDHLRPAPVRADARNVDFRPVVTVGDGGSWVHGYRRDLRTASR